MVRSSNSLKQYTTDTSSHTYGIPTHLTAAQAEVQCAVPNSSLIVDFFSYLFVLPVGEIKMYINIYEGWKYG